MSSSASNRIIHAKDHASIQLSLADVDETTGRVTGSVKHYLICGDIRRMVCRMFVTNECIPYKLAYYFQGESDDCVNRLAKRDSILPKTF